MHFFLQSFVKFCDQGLSYADSEADIKLWLEGTKLIKRKNKKLSGNLWKDTTAFFFFEN
jgi:hypothetical protein